MKAIRNVNGFHKKPGRAIPGFLEADYCLSLSLSSHLQMKWQVTSAATETKKVIRNGFNDSHLLSVARLESSNDIILHSLCILLNNFL